MRKCCRWYRPWPSARRVSAALASDQTILTLENGLDDKQQKAQKLAVADAQFQAFARDPETNQPVRSEIMIVRPALPADLTDATAAACGKGDCYRVEMFNYNANATTVALVDIAKGDMVDVTFNPDVQPELPGYLADLAAQIAINSPEVAEALGFKPGAGLAGMPGVKTALNDSQCERSHHLCVGPTFLLHDQGRALWAIVDLTEGRLVGIRWTDTGQGDAEPVTEQSLQDAVVMANFCEKVLPLARDGWDLGYSLTSSDGLEIKDVQFQGRPVLNSAKLVDWHVSYSGKDGFGYSDATGCPLFSTASVVAFNGPVPSRTSCRMVRWSVSPWCRISAASCGRCRATTATCSATSFTTTAASVSVRQPGPGLWQQRHLSSGGADGVSGARGRGGPTTIAEWNGDAVDALGEGRLGAGPPAPPTRRKATSSASPGDDGRATCGAQPRSIRRRSRGDNAFVYVTLAKPEEGDADMITIGPCCNTDYQQGPEKFMEPPEPITASDLVMWYVPQLKNDDTPGQEYCWVNTKVVDGVLVNEIHPCAFGVLFVPAP